MFHRALQRVWLTNRGRLLLWTPCPVQNCISPFSLELVMFSDFEFRTSLGTYILLCSILLCSSIHSTALLIQFLQSPCTSLSRHVYNWNIVACNIKQPFNSTEYIFRLIILFRAIPQMAVCSRGSTIATSNIWGKSQIEIEDGPNNTWNLQEKGRLADGKCLLLLWWS